MSEHIFRWPNHLLQTKEWSCVDYMFQVNLIFILKVDHVPVERADPATVQKESASSMLKFKV